jgi:hypothetical protein
VSVGPFHNTEMLTRMDSNLTASKHAHKLVVTTTQASDTTVMRNWDAVRRPSSPLSPAQETGTRGRLG